MNALKTVIVDDEPLARQGLRLRLDEIQGIDVVSECANGREALRAITEHVPDLILLDIQMPGLSGFDVISRLQQDNMPMIIFVTAYDQYAVEAFGVHAIDYLLKPIDVDRLNAAVDRARSALNQRVDKQRLLEIVIGITGKSESSVARLLQDHTSGAAYPSKLAIKDGAETTLVATRDIGWIDAAGDYMCVHANDETHVMRTTMKELEATLDPAIFQRVHRSTIVNLQRVSKLCSHMNGEYYLELDNNLTIKMSRSYKDKVAHLL